MSDLHNENNTAAAGPIDHTVPEVSIYHISEIFLYEYYINRGDYHIRPRDLCGPLIESGIAQEKHGGLMGALQKYKQALRENPVSMEVYEHVVNILRKVNRLEEMADYVRQSWPFCCTRAELAWYYRMLGYYYLEKYRPELSQICYRYSTLFRPSRQAEEDIKYLETALNRKMPDYTAEEMQKALSDEGIPTKASDVTLALLYKAAGEALEDGYPDQARDCYAMLYDLTQDEEVLEHLKALTPES